MLLFCLLFFSYTDAKAQNKAEVQLWENYSLRKFVNKYRFWIRNDIGLRQNFTQQSSAYSLRPRLIINIGNVFDIQPGIDFRYTNYNSLPNVTEIRTWQGVGAHWPDIGRVMFEHLYRFEQRFIYTTNTSGKEVGLRSRYRLYARVPINNKVMTEKTYYIDFRSEFFFPHDKEVSERFANSIRVGINVGYNHNAKWRYYGSFIIDHGKNNFDSDRTIDSYIVSLTLRNVF